MGNFLKLFGTSIILCSLLFLGCKKFGDFNEIELADNDAEYAIPLVSASTTITDIMEQTGGIDSMVIDSDDKIYLYYKGDLTARYGTDIFAFLELAPFPLTDNITRYFLDLPANLDLDLVDLKSGWIGVLIAGSGYNGIADITIKIPQMVKDGVPLEVDFSAGTLHLDSFLVDVSGYRMNLPTDSLTVFYEAYDSEGNEIPISNFIIAARNFEFEYIQGFMGTDAYEMPRDTIMIDFFDNWVQGNIYFADPRIYMNVVNSFGFPVRSQVTVMDIFTVTGEVLPLDSEFVTNGIDIDYPPLDAAGETRETFFEFTTANSNIDEVLGAGPIGVDYDIDGIPNPDNDSTFIGFMTDESFFKIQVEVELPIYGSVSSFLGRDTFDVNFDEYDNVDYAEFKIITENEMPLGVDFQLYLADENNVVLDSMFMATETLLEAAPVNSLGEVTEKAIKTTFVDFDKERFETVKAAKKVFLKVYFSTSNNGTENVWILADQTIDFRMGMKIGTSQ